MHALIFNSGSSSLSFKVYDVQPQSNSAVIVFGKATNVATTTKSDPTLFWNFQNESSSKITNLSTHRLAAQEIIKVLAEKQIKVDIIGHRFVHGGTIFDHTVQIDPLVIDKLGQCARLAPIHNPNTLKVVEACLEQLPGIPQFAVFDTSFHANLSEASKRYAIPKEIAEEYSFQKYGFHGLSYQYISNKVAELVHRPLNDLKLIVCHLGTGGSSVAAIKNGKSVDTSMGYSPLAGLVMSTRCGDIDPEIVLELGREGYSPDEISHILNHQSGLIGLSEYSSNLLEIIEAAENGDIDCQIAYDVYTHRLKLYLGAYTWLLNGADAIIFTDDVGMKAWKMREKACMNIDHLGIYLDKEINRRAPSDQSTLVSSPQSTTQIWTIPTDEEYVILQEMLAKLSQ